MNEKPLLEETTLPENFDEFSKMLDLELHTEKYTNVNKREGLKP